MTAKNTALFSLLLLPALLPASARAEDTDLKFSGLSYPLELQLPAGQKVGGVLLETAERDRAGNLSLYYQVRRKEPSGTVHHHALT